MSAGNLFYDLWRDECMRANRFVEVNCDLRCRLMEAEGQRLTLISHLKSAAMMLETSSPVVATGIETMLHTLEASYAKDTAQPKRVVETDSTSDARSQEPAPAAQVSPVAGDSKSDPIPYVDLPQAVRNEQWDQS